MTIVDMDRKRRDAIEAEAREWVIRLDGGDLSAEEMETLRQWASRSPQYYAALREMAGLWGALDGLAALSPLMAHAEEQPKAESAAPRRAPARRFRGLAAAAAILVLACAGLLGLASHQGWFPNGQAHALHATARGEQRVVTLPDGSQAQLNTDSLLEVDFERGLRRVRLVRGEAMFDVIPDSGRPFIVYADSGSIRVVGTVFTVRVRPNQLDVVVTEGAVELAAQAAPSGSAPDGAAALLTAGFTATLSGGSLTVHGLSAREMERRTAWSNGALVFYGDRLADVLAEMTRYTDLHIDILDPELRDTPIGGRFRIGEMEAFLDALENGFEIDVTREGDRVLLSRSDRT